MVKQKIVMRVSMESARERSKALKTVVGSAGVISASVEGDTIVVVGDEMDAITLTKTLRKKMRFAELVSVGPVPAQEKKKEEKAAGGEGEGGGGGGEAKSVWPYPYPYQTVVLPYHGSMAQPVQLVHDDAYDPCSIM